MAVGIESSTDPLAVSHWPHPCVATWLDRSVGRSVGGTSSYTVSTAKRRPSLVDHSHCSVLCVQHDGRSMRYGGYVRGRRGILEVDVVFSQTVSCMHMSYELYDQVPLCMRQLSVQPLAAASYTTIISYFTLCKMLCCLEYDALNALYCFFGLLLFSCDVVWWLYHYHCNAWTHIDDPQYPCFSAALQALWCLSVSVTHCWWLYTCV